MKNLNPPVPAPSAGPKATALPVCLIAADTRARYQLGDLIRTTDALRLLDAFPNVEAAETLLSGREIKAALLHVDGAAAPDGLIRQVRFFAEKVPIVAYAERADASSLFGSLAAGASACVLENAPPDQLIQAISEASHGRVFLCRQAQWQAHERLRLIERKPGNKPLTERERQICVWLAARNEKNIARALNLAVDTVHTHAKSLYRKLHVHTRKELLRLLCGAH